MIYLNFITPFAENGKDARRRKVLYISCPFLARVFSPFFSYSLTTQVYAGDDRFSSMSVDLNPPPISAFCLRRKDGTIRHALIRVGTVPGIKRIVFSGMDVTELKRMKEALKESESRFRGAFDASTTGVALVDLDGRLQKVNQWPRNRLGYCQQELLARTLRDISHPDDPENDLEY